jgi:hypothetical protein
MAVELKYAMTDENADRVIAAVLWKNPKPPGVTVSDAAWVRVKIREHIVKLVHQYERHQAYVALNVEEDPTVIT